MKPVLILVYSAVFATAYAGAMAWITERGDKTYRLGTSSFSDCFLSGIFWLLLTFGINLAVLWLAPARAFLCAAALLTFLAGHIAVKEKGYRRKALLKGEGRGQTA